MNEILEKKKIFQNFSRVSIKDQERIRDELAAQGNQIGLIDAFISLPYLHKFTKLIDDITHHIMGETDIDGIFGKEDREKVC